MFQNSRRQLHIHSVWLRVTWAWNDFRYSLFRSFLCIWVIIRLILLRFLSSIHGENFEFHRAEGSELIRLVPVIHLIGDNLIRCTSRGGSGRRWNSGHSIMDNFGSTTFAFGSWQRCTITHDNTVIHIHATNPLRDEEFGFRTVTNAMTLFATHYAIHDQVCLWS